MSAPARPRRLASVTAKRSESWAKKLFAYGGFDFPFMLIVTVLLCLGLVMMFSASYVNALKHEGDAYYYIKRQGIFALLGVIAMLSISKINLNVLRRLAIPALGLGAAYNIKENYFQASFILGIDF